MQSEARMEYNNRLYALHQRGLDCDTFNVFKKLLDLEFRDALNPTTKQTPKLKQPKVVEIEIDVVEEALGESTPRRRKTRYRDYGFDYIESSFLPYVRPGSFMTGWVKCSKPF